MVSTKKLFDICDNNDKKITNDNENAQQISEIGNIEFKNISFGYSLDKNVFENLNLTIEHNKFNAFCGYSGGGKSTILNLLLKLYEPKSGVILMNSKNIREWTTKSIINKVGYVGQDSIVFDETVRDNIQVGIDDILSAQQIDSLMEKVNGRDV